MAQQAQAAGDRYSRGQQLLHPAFLVARAQLCTHWPFFASSRRCPGPPRRRRSRRRLEKHASIALISYQGAWVQGLPVRCRQLPTGSACRGFKGHGNACRTASTFGTSAARQREHSSPRGTCGGGGAAAQQLTSRAPARRFCMHTVSQAVEQTSPHTHSIPAAPSNNPSPSPQCAAAVNNMRVTRSCPPAPAPPQPPRAAA